MSFYCCKYMVLYHRTIWGSWEVGWGSMWNLVYIAEIKHIVWGARCWTLHIYRTRGSDTFLLRDQWYKVNQIRVRIPTKAKAEIWHCLFDAVINCSWHVNFTNLATSRLKKFEKNWTYSPAFFLLKILKYGESYFTS